MQNILIKKKKVTIFIIQTYLLIQFVYKINKKKILKTLIVKVSNRYNIKLFSPKNGFIKKKCIIVYITLKYSLTY